MSIKRFINTIAEEIDIIFRRKTRDKVYSSKNTFDNLNDCEQAFQKSVEKLFNINQWSLLPGITCTFELFNNQGARKKSGSPGVGDFVRIILPGPLPENWVQITHLKKESDNASFTVSPSTDPTDKDEKVEHFFIDEATSTFKVERKGIEIIAYEIGKTEGINNKGKEAGEREVLNTMIAEGGWAGFQKLQWEKLTDYLVHKTELENK